MSALDRLLAVLAPYECLGCAAEGALLCRGCMKLLPEVPGYCYRCQTASSKSLTCRTCDQSSGLYRVLAGTEYSGVAKGLVLKLKFSGTKASARIMATHLLTLLPRSGREQFIVPVPTAARRVRARGYDQARLLAREISRQARLPYLDCLARSGHTRQLGQSRQKRLAQLNGAFRVRRLWPPDAELVLVDDVLTTGATLETAAATLKAAGTGRITALVFARA